MHIYLLLVTIVYVVLNLMWLQCMACIGKQFIFNC